MPGIIGFSNNKIERSQTIIGKMQEIITYECFYQKDYIFCDHSVSASRVNTNIIQTEKQPYSDSGVYAWLDGELYNGQELTSDLNLHGLTDLQILVNLFLRKNDNKFSFLKKIDGIYVAVIYDTRTNEIHLISDRYGLRHIYWTVLNGNLIWSSELKAFLVFPAFKPVIDRQAVKEFFSVGYLLEDRTWFKGVDLLSSGTVLTWSIKNSSVRSQRYWWWDNIKSLPQIKDDREIAEEFGNLFVNAVNLRSRPDERVSSTLSGGLDSRAILAAMPDYGYPIHVITFGEKDCDDIRIAAMAAHVKGAVHHVVDLAEDNWLSPRIDRVWRTDGHLNIMDLHGIGSLGELDTLFHLTFNGFAGDLIAGGSYLVHPHLLDSCDKKVIADILNCDPELLTNFNKYENLPKSDYYFLQNRVRRFTDYGTKLALTYREQRKPFYDNKLIEFIYGLKDSYRFRSRLYKKMLLHKFPAYFQHIPWQKTGVSIGYSETTTQITSYLMTVKKRISGLARSLGINVKNTHNYADYPGWIRKEPARSFFYDVFTSQDAIYPAFIDKTQVLNEWETHLTSNKDRADIICLYLTFEIWLQQVFTGKYLTK
jgi:asparagine synthase (glutamine-hydrolysing)